MNSIIKIYNIYYENKNNELLLNHLSKVLNFRLIELKLNIFVDIQQ